MDTTEFLVRAVHEMTQLGGRVSEDTAEELSELIADYDHKAEKAAESKTQPKTGAKS